MLYFTGVIIVSLAFGGHFGQFYGWLFFGSSLIVASLLVYLNGEKD